MRIPGVSWDDYEQLLAALGVDYHVRVSYDCGDLEMMSPLPEQEEFVEAIQDAALETAQAWVRAHKPPRTEDRLSMIRKHQSLPHMCPTQNLRQGHCWCHGNSA